jgi:hypothetical protein
MQLNRYLLGELNEQQMAEIEQRLEDDPHGGVWIAVAEDDLADRFVRGQLTRDERERFESNFLCSDERRRKVAFARTILAEAQRREEKISFRERVAAWLQPASSWKLAGSVAMLIAAYAGTFTVMRTAELQHELTSVRERMTRELGTERAAREAAEKKLADLLIASFVLAPGTGERSSGSPELLVPLGAALVRLQLRLPSEFPTAPALAVLRNNAGEQIASAEVAVVTNGGGTRMANFTFPAAGVVQGAYEVELAPLSPSSIRVAYSLFVVRR